MSRQCAYVTLLTNAEYFVGVLVLNQSLRDVNSRYPLVVMTVPYVPAELLEALAREGVKTRMIPPLRLLEGQVGPDFLNEARFSDVWAKLRAFEMEEYDRIVLLDSDMLVKKNMDDLFDMQLPADWIAAAHVCACNPWKLKHYPADWIPENCAHTSVKRPDDVPVIKADSPRPYRQLNSGTVVLNPSKALMDSLVEFMHKDADVSRWAFPDQDLLADYFAGRWKPLHWYYNSLITLIHAHDDMWDESHVRCVHYIGKQKPWRARKSADAEHQSQRDWWWATYDAFEKELEQRDPETAKLMKQGVAL